jgi:hypothetical protein
MPPFFPKGIYKLGNLVGLKLRSVEKLGYFLDFIGG